MFSFMRLGDVVRTKNASNNPVTYESGRAMAQFNGPNAEYALSFKIPPNTAEHGISIFQPPPHYHIYQSENFRVQSGSGNFYLGIDPKPAAVLSADGRNTITLPHGVYHRFENASKTEDLVLDIHLLPEEYEREERFFRNLFGYLDDCKKSKVEPSVLQMIVFLQTIDVVLALPLPSHALGLAVSRVFTFAMAEWAKWALGYRPNYEEYYKEKS